MTGPGSRGPLPRALAPLALPASWLYGLAVALRNARYDRGGAQSIGIPVISVGNLSAGGTGKTPMVRWVARQLIALGCAPVVAMRGYAARRGEPSDEEREHREALPAVPVVAHPDRTGALRSFLASHPEMNCAVLDDGFQHRRLKRDLDLVLLDATAGTLGDRLLPCGWLREPPGSLRRADAVVITRAGRVEPGLAAAVQHAHGRPPVAWCRHAWTGLRILGPSGAERAGVEWLEGRCVVSLLGVGNPRAVRAQLVEAGAVIAADLPAADHEHFRASKIAHLRRLCAGGGAEALVTTAKDWARAAAFIDPGSWPVPVVLPCLEIEFLQGAAALERLIADTISAARPGP
jgi:tetraacyldisaccharide 4'-kinase